MQERYDKSEFMAATRQILTEIAAWTDTLFGQGAAERLTAMPPGRDPEYDDNGVTAYIERTAAVRQRDWKEAGCRRLLAKLHRAFSLKPAIGEQLGVASGGNDYGNTVCR